jgi:hypothetical protein
VTGALPAALTGKVRSAGTGSSNLLLYVSFTHLGRHTPTSMFMRSSRGLLMLATSVAAAACDSTPTGDICHTAAPQPRVAPRERTLALGAAYTAEVASLICAGSRTTPFTGVWRSADTAVATVASTTGLIRATGRGRTHVFAVHVTAGVPRRNALADALLVIVP